MTRRAPRVIAVLALAATAVACRAKPAPGAPCAVPDQLVCAAADRALVCEPQGHATSQRGPAWAAVPCRGAAGCARRGEIDECDDTLAAEGDACPRSPPLDYACTADRAEALACKEGRFGLWRACRGPEGCQVMEGRNVRCDTTLGAPGDPCVQQGTYACAVDRRSMLACDAGALAVASSCRGPNGCRIERAARKVDCDDSVAQEGDPCDKPGRLACAVGGHAELACKAGRYAKKRDCARTACRLEGDELFCD